MFYDKCEIKHWLKYLAFVNVDLTVASSETRQAGAGVVVDAINAGGAIQAGVGLALVNVDLAVHTF